MEICCGVVASMPGGEEPSRRMGGRVVGCTGVERPEPARLGGEEESRCLMGLRLAELGRRRYSSTAALSSSVKGSHGGGRTASIEERKMSWTVWAEDEVFKNSL